MHIKQNCQLRFRSSNFYPLNSQLEYPIALVYDFFHDAYGSIQSKGIPEYMNIVNTPDDGIMDYELVSVSIDHKNSLIYISEGYLDYRHKPTTPEIRKLLDQENFVQLCQMNFFEYVVMTKENFYHIIISYDQIWKQESIMFALLYQDEKNWFDVLPFETEEAMRQFVVNHAQQK